MADPQQRHNLADVNQKEVEGFATTYENYAVTLARPDLVAPPIDLDATRGPVRLLAHEGSPMGDARFQGQHGWANDFFVDLGRIGARWPVKIAKGGMFTVKIRYHLDDDQARPLVLRTDRS